MAFYKTTLDQALSGQDAAVAALSILMLGLRAGEILDRKVRDVDSSDAGVLLWVENGKTDAATRHLGHPDDGGERLRAGCRQGIGSHFSIYHQAALHQEGNSRTGPS